MPSRGAPSNVAPMQRRGDVDLSGRWRAAPADDPALRLGFVDDAVDDDGWEPLAVPGHWRSSPAFAEHDGPLLYRTRFEAPHRDDRPLGERSFVELDGVFAASDVWLDGTYLGDTSGYVVPHAFEVTELVADRHEHLLAMEVSCGPVGSGPTRDLTGAFGRSALLAKGHNPGGIWKPVRLRRTGPVRLRFTRLRCPEADPTKARLALRAVLDTLDARTVTLRTSVRRAPLAGEATAPLDAPLVLERDHPLAAGENRVEWTVTVPEPELWWPLALGGQPLYDVTVEVVVEDEVSDERTWRTGLRQVRMRDFRFSVNDEVLFLKGASVGPTRLLLADATPEEVADDVDLAIGTGLDLVRVHGHVGRPELYEAADRAGLLVWQDLPVQWALQRSTKAPARRVARATVDLLAHHPSVVVWCAHHEPFAGDPDSWRGDPASGLLTRRRREVLAQVVPSWNRTVLDRSLASVLAGSDPSRPVVTHSGVWPHLPQLSGTSTHLWAGWRWGGIGSLATLLRWWPRLGRFVAEFGAQAPGADGWLGPAPSGPEGIEQGAGAAGTADLVDAGWTALSDRSALEVGAALRAVPPGPGAEGWDDRLREHQAEVLRSHVETLRRLKYRPCGGFAAFSLTEPAPGVTAAVVDHARRPKPALAALREACAAVLAVIDRPPDTIDPSAPLRLDLHVVNDRRAATGELALQVDASWDGVEVFVEHRGWAGSVAADAVARVGTLTLVPPPGAEGLELVVELREGPTVLGRRIHRRSVRAT
jgi:beta-mannosidase